MTNTIPKEYFDNRKEQAEIRMALTEAIPPDVYYHNLIIALSGMLSRAVEDAYREEVYTKTINEKKDRWIPVYEEVPQDHEVVWAINPLMHQGLAYWDRESAHWYWNTPYASRAEITHWRTLTFPAPPDAA